MKDINEKLGTEKLAANMFDMERFPDQSQINTLLTGMGVENVTQLTNIHHNLFTQHSYSANADGNVVVDFDQSGLIANGKSYELAEKGYFSKKKNQKGYQLSATFAGEYQETVWLFLDEGSTHCSERFDDLLKITLSKYKEQFRDGNLILRTDSGYGSSDNVEKLSSIPNLKFITKGYSTTSAAKLAKDIPYSNYTKADSSAWVYELPKNDNNLIIWFKKVELKDSKLEDVCINTLVKEIGTIKGFVTRTAEEIIVNIPPFTKLSKLIGDALCKSKEILSPEKTWRSKKTANCSQLLN